MARIPTANAFGVEPSGQAAPALRNVEVGGFDSLARGAQQLGRGVGTALEHAATEFDKRQEESRKKAQEAEVTEADAQWTRYRTERKHGRRGSGDARRDAIEGAFNGEDVEQEGYYNLKGDDAFKAAPETFESIEKKRQELADEMSDDEAKQLFLKRTQPHLEHDRAEIESFAGKQRQVADVATLQAREQAALEAIRASPNDFVEVSKQIAALDEPTRRLGLSDADKQARVDDWRRRAGVAQVVGQLNAGDWASAEKTLESKRNTIGSAAAEKLEAEIQKAKGDAGAELKAEAIVKGSVKGDGQVDWAQAVALVDEVPAGRERDEVRQRVHQRLVEQKQTYDRETDELGQRAGAQYALGGWKSIPPGTKEELRVRDYKLYLALRDDAEGKWKRMQGSKSDQAKAQAEYDESALRQYKLQADSAGEREKLPLEPFLRLFPDLSKKGRELIELAAQGDRQLVDKGASVPEAKFMSRGKEWGQATIKDKKKRAQYEDELSSVYADWARAHDGKPPTEAEAEEQLAKLQGKVIKKGWVFDSTEYGFEARRRRKQQQADAEKGASVLPDTVQQRPTAAERAKQLQAAGKSRAEATDILKSEGY